MGEFADARLASEWVEESELAGRASDGGGVGGSDFEKLARVMTARAGLGKSSSDNSLSFGTPATVNTPRVSENVRTLKSTTTGHLTTATSFGSESSMYGGGAFENLDKNIVFDETTVENDAFAPSMAEATETMAPATRTGGEDNAFAAASELNSESVRRSARMKFASSPASSRDPFQKASSRMRGSKLKNVTAMYSKIRVVSLGMLTEEDIQLCINSIQSKPREPKIRPVFIPRGYEVNGMLFEEPFSASVDENGVHKVTWGAEGEGRLIARSDDGAMNAEDACACIAQEITRRYLHRIPSVKEPVRARVTGNTRCANESCGVASTPLMRRGPNGMRTLCNACGLWYARRGTMRPCGKGIDASQNIAVAPPPPPTTTTMDGEEEEIFIREPPTKDTFNALMAFGYQNSHVLNAIRTACKSIHSAQKASRSRAKLECAKGIANLYSRETSAPMFDSCDNLESFVGLFEPDASTSSKRRTKVKAKNSKLDGNKRQKKASKSECDEMCKLFMELDDLPWESKVQGDLLLAVESPSQEPDTVDDDEDAHALKATLPRPESAMTLTREDAVGDDAMDELFHMPPNSEELINVMQTW